ncbi:MAG: SpoVA/SpoVAEb family sporulation membrane protein [Bacilli bacterium]|nr:SpoVA/SpoVAEb family sporulation membrane protein [Bacilli bacterium]
MTLIYSFLFCGLLCLIAQVIMDNTKLTPGHITSIYVVLGTILGCFNIYDNIVDFVGAGANIPIISFGNLLINSAYQGYLSDGIIGLFGNMLTDVGVGVVSAVVFAFLLSIPFKVKD